MFFLVDEETVRKISLYGLDILRNEENNQICFGLTVPDPFFSGETPIEVVVNILKTSEYSEYLFPLKKIHFFGVEVFVPNNPVLFLEKLYEDPNDAFKEVNIFDLTSSKVSQWKKVCALVESSWLV